MTKEDTQRLDWLSSHPSALGIKPQYVYGIYGNPWLETNEFTDIRALIDAAMTSDPNRGGMYE